MMDAAELFDDPDEATVPDARILAWLTAKGISPAALGTPWAVHVGKVLFFDRHAYVPNRLGENALIFAVIDEGIVDLVAWEPKSGKIGTRLGVGGCLGQGQIGRDGLGTHGAPLSVWRNPLNWLGARRRGIVIADPVVAAHHLAGLNLVAEDEQHATELRAALALPPPSVTAPARAREAA